jgi:hypothetical protein
MELKKYVMDMLTLWGTMLEFRTHNMNGHMEYTSKGGAQYWFYLPTWMHDWCTVEG